MLESGSFRTLFPRPIRELPVDLAAVVAVVVATTLTVFAPVFQGSPVRLSLGLIFVLFVPGYAFVAALFPENGPSRRSSDADESKETSNGLREQSEKRSVRTGIGSLERIALSIGSSIVVFVLFGLALNYTLWGVRLTPIVLTVSVFTLVTTGIAAFRRSKIPSKDRFQVPYREWYTVIRSALREPDTGADAVLNVFIVVAVVASFGAGGYATTVPTHGEQFSAVSLMTEDDDGNPVAGNLPTEFERGDSQELIVGVDNHEQRPVTYTVVAVEQTVVTDGNETVVTAQNELDQFETRLSHGETWRFRHDLEPTMTGEAVRIVWLVYLDGDVPPEPSLENADYAPYLWGTVSESAVGD
ncbi:DUF1616 domain-containing protein [Natrinema sp. SYSU A 869]|uniref:DUF1616 domain-containing protein n=1 Tax=Natrinema sp. SYSU A 869 TaxID=2871694 RepID=UPI001CA462F3|nr:DUF1616 domain-containing protein [Natrinema sp. SYSU A 869]